MRTAALHNPAEPRDEVPWRAVVFVGAVLLAWITLKPYADLGAEDLLDLAVGRDALTYAVFASCSAACLFLVWSMDRRLLRCLAVPAFGSLAAWVGVSVVASQDVSTSLKRAAICAFACVIAASLPLLPRGRQHLAALLALVSGVLLALCYFGVIFMPQYAIHQATDFVEPALAGDWRGVFSHKNDASAVFVFVIFIGVYVARVGDRLVGVLIAALSLLFVLCARGKAANMLWPLAFFVPLFIRRFGAGWGWAVAALAPFVALNALGVGSVLFQPLGALVAKLPIDPTFTGRDEIWRFAIEKLAEHPLLGFGFDAFWNTASVRFGADDTEAWVGVAASAHNGFLNAAMSMGIPGLALTLWAFVAQPLADIGKAMRNGADPALVTMLAQIWLFGIYISSFESFLFERSNSVWFTFLFAVFALRYAATYRTSAQ